MTALPDSRLRTALARSRNIALRRVPAGLRLSEARLALPGLSLAGVIGLKLMAYAALTGVPLGQAMCQWDCGWYLSIVQDGYDSASRFVANCCWQANWAFFPLLPMLVRGLRAVTDSDPALLGVLVSSACLFAFALLGIRLRRITRGERTPWLWLAFLLSWPFGFYFHALYTEALFAALATAALIALAEARPWLAASATAFLTATRPTGILLAAWIGLRQAWSVRGARTPGQALRILLPAAVAPLGLLAFMLFLRMKLGDALAFQHIQAGWGRTGGNPLRVLLEPFRGLMRGRAEFEGFYFAAWALLGAAASFWLLAKRRFAEAWLCGLPILLALGSGVLISMPRLVSTNPAFLFAAADWFALVGARKLRLIILLLMLLLQAWLLLAWLRSPRFLM